LSALLEVDGLCVDLPTRRGVLHAVRDASFEVDRGETLCLVGESGCGKSTTALALMNLLPGSARRRGVRIGFDGQNLLDLPERRMSALRGNRMSMIFQEPMTSLNPSYTIGDQLEEVMLRHRRVSRSVARDAAVTLLDRAGVHGSVQRMRQFPHQLSGGLRQRVMIAMALMCSPDLLIADEPTTALDVTVQAQILHLLNDLKRDFGMALILITHDLGVVARMADRVAVMYAGSIVESAPAKDLFANPRHPYTRGLLACLPKPANRGRTLGTIPGSVAAPVGDLQGCQFRNRCAHTAEICATGPLPVFDLPEGHRYICRLSPEQQLAGLAGMPETCAT
jgi:peptide/nickel transport system ATP-binding protein